MQIREKKVAEGKIEIFSQRKTTKIENDEYRERKKLEKLRKNKAFDPDTKLQAYEYEGVQHVRRKDGEFNRIEFIGRSELDLKPGTYSILIIGWETKKEGKPLILILGAYQGEAKIDEVKKDGK